ncbi:hypothetical protein TrVE_jg14262 [Triparma verrucosa]|uniref:Trypsin-like serine protease n=1 Tax=Triparma verrucosa TaxID=1606542 RepID=A0A9W7F063_9STRA|nr:hypothetical protein TrVE_jg14262 [Triparma verrucosa]
MATYALTSWFRLPSQGMKSYEILSRASCFLLNPSETTKIESTKEVPPIVLTSQHVIRPFHFPKYYPEPWIQFISQSDIKIFLEIRSPTGQILLKTELQHPHHHSSRDISILEFPPNSLPPPSLKISRLNSSPFTPHLPITCSGHVLSSQDEDTSSSPSSPSLLPLFVPGKLTYTSPSQSFASTKKILTMGMCGGPVLNNNNDVIGMVEGIVPKGASKDDLLEGMVAFIGGNVIEEFVEGYGGKIKKEGVKII